MASGGFNPPMLHLHQATPADWGPRAAAHIDEILIDHAHLEKKAASTALTLLFRYPDEPALQRPLSALAREELSHFELVLDHIDARGGTFGKAFPSAYAAQLSQQIRRAEPLRLLDTLLVCALIEARSCERMKHLAEALPAGPLADLYAGLLASEARHHTLYVDLCEQIFAPAEVRERLSALAIRESEIIAALPREARLHSRAPA